MRKPSSLLPRRPARKTSPRERVVGGVILALLVAGLALFVIAGGGAGPPSLIAQAAPGPSAAKGPFALTSPAGWPRGAIEHYDVDGLFEKINGKADGYIAYDIVDLTFAGYANPKDPSLYVDVYIYDMAEPLNAFGIYRAQRSGKEAGVEVGEEACGSGSAFFARKGRHYVEVIGSADAAAAEAQAVLGAVVEALPPGTAPVREPTYFPEEGRTRILYVREGALGVESLWRAFVARYEGGANAVVAECESNVEAEEVRKEALETFGFLGTKAHFATARDGIYVVGATGGTDEARLRALVGEIVKRLEEAP